MNLTETKDYCRGVSDVYRFLQQRNCTGAAQKMLERYKREIAVGWEYPGLCGGGPHPREVSRDAVEQAALQQTRAFSTRDLVKDLARQGYTAQPRQVAQILKYLERYNRLQRLPKERVQSRPCWRATNVPEQAQFPRVLTEEGDRGGKGTDALQSDSTTPSRQDAAGDR